MSGSRAASAGRSRVTGAQSAEPAATPAAGRHRWRLQVVHRTRFPYSGPVRSSYNEARLTPENSNRQTTLRSRVEIEPAASAYAYRDYWGSTVTAFDLHTPHAELVVTGTSIVEAGPDLGGHDRVGLERAGAPARCASSSASCSRRPRSPPWTTRSWPRRAAPSATPHPHEAGPLVCRFVARAHGVPVRLDEREDQRHAGLDQGQGRLPGHLARHRRPAARPRAAGPLRLRLPAPQARRRRSASRSPARATPGWSGGTAAGTASTRPTPSRSAPGT